MWRPTLPETSASHTRKTIAEGKTHTSIIPKRVKVKIKRVPGG
jgi:hypothetical protein